MSNPLAGIAVHRHSRPVGKGDRHAAAGYSGPAGFAPLGALPGARRDVERLVWARNTIWLAVLLDIAAVWATTIAGFGLSLAAVAGALPILGKELVMCVHG